MPNWGKDRHTFLRLRARRIEQQHVQEISVTKPDKHDATNFHLTPRVGFIESYSVRESSTRFDPPGFLQHTSDGQIQAHPPSCVTAIVAKLEFQLTKTGVTVAASCRINTGEVIERYRYDAAPVAFFYVAKHLPAPYETWHGYIRGEAKSRIQATKQSIAGCKR